MPPPESEYETFDFSIVTPPPPPATPEKDAKLSQAKPINQREVDTLLSILPTQLEALLPKDTLPKGKGIITELFLSDREYREVAGQVIRQAASEFTARMGEGDKAELVAKKLFPLIESRIKAKKEITARIQREMKESPESSGRETHIKARIKAEEIFASGEVPFDTVEFSGAEEGQGYIAHRNAQGKVDVYCVMEKLDSGGSATVQKVQNVATGVFLALKTSKVVPVVDADLRKPYERVFTRGADLSRMVHPTTLLISEKMIGYLMPLHEVSAASLLTDSRYASYCTRQNRESVMCQVLGQQFSLEDRGLLNIDLKPKNVMVNSVREAGSSASIPKLSAQLIDLDDAVDIRCLSDSPRDPRKLQTLVNEILASGVSFVGGTSDFVSQYDAEEVPKLKKEAADLPKLDEGVPTEADIDKVVEFLKKYKKAVQSRVIFTLGATCYMILAKGEPYGVVEIDGRLTPNTDPKLTWEYDQRLRELGYSKELVEFLRRMMSPEPRHRPVRAEVETFFKSFKILTDEEFDKQREAALEPKYTRYVQNYGSISNLQEIITSLEPFGEGQDLIDMRSALKFMQEFEDLRKKNRGVRDRS